MPTYDYVCNACDHEFELFQQMTDGVKRKCPECGKLKLRRLVGTGAGVIFKGSGFYQTDYRSDSYRKGAEADKKSAEGAKKSGEKSGEKKGGDGSSASKSGSSSDASSSKSAKSSGKSKS
jgi:putative FmdB family regulatory protein